MIRCDILYIKLRVSRIRDVVAGGPSQLPPSDPFHLVGSEYSHCKYINSCNYVQVVLCGWLCHESMMREGKDSCRPSQAHVSPLPRLYPCSCPPCPPQRYFPPMQRLIWIECDESFAHAFCLNSPSSRIDVSHDTDDVEAVAALRGMLTSASRLSIKRMPGGWTPAGGSPQGMSPRGVSPVRTSGDTYSDPITRGASPGGSSPRGDVQYLRGRSPTPPLPALKASASATTLASTMGRSEEEVVSNQYLTAPLAD